MKLNIKKLLPKLNHPVGMTKDCTCLNCLHGYRQTLHTMVKASSKIEILEAKAQEGLIKGIYQVCSSLLVYLKKIGGNTHSQFGHYFCSNLHGRAPRGPRSVKKSKKNYYK